MRPSPYDESHRYMVAVLWLHGKTESEIATWMGKYGGIRMTRGAVAGVINRSGDGEIRNLRNKAERQAMLDRICVHRLDKGILPRIYFTAVETRTGKR